MALALMNLALVLEAVVGRISRNPGYRDILKFKTLIIESRNQFIDRILDLTCDCMKL